MSKKEYIYIYITYTGTHTCQVREEGGGWQA
jgi:hypothetical protein